MSHDTNFSSSSSFTSSSSSFSLSFFVFRQRRKTAVLERKKRKHFSQKTSQKKKGVSALLYMYDANATQKRALYALTLEKHKKRTVCSFSLSKKERCHPGLNWGPQDLQSYALPLSYNTLNFILRYSYNPNPTKYNKYSQSTFQTKKKFLVRREVETASSRGCAIRYT